MRKKSQTNLRRRLCDMTRRSTPWILLTRGEKFDVFKEQLRTATKAGAIGFLAGRAVWQEYSEFKDDLAGKKKFLEETVKNRFREICDVVLGKNSQ